MQKAKNEKKELARLQRRPNKYEEVCPNCNSYCGHEERGYCIEDECPICGKWLENCECED